MILSWSSIRNSKKGHRIISATGVQRTTTLYRVSRRIQFYNIGKRVYFFIYFSVNFFHYPVPDVIYLPWTSAEHLRYLPVPDVIYLPWTSAKHLRYLYLRVIISFIQTTTLYYFMTLKPLIHQVLDRLLFIIYHSLFSVCFHIYSFSPFGS
jgi:hypothetical protein